MLTDLRKLRHVVAVAQAESFTRAAASLAITQSALTKSVADVEHLLGVKLFRRLPRGVALTDAGRTFVIRARQILADTQDLMNAVDEHRELAAGRFALGVAPAPLQGVVVQAVARFAELYPGLTIEVYDGPFDRMAQSLVAGEIDMLLSLGSFLNSWPDLPWATLGRLHYSFFGRRDHPAAHQQPLSAAELLAYPIILPPSGLPMSAEIAQALQRAGVSPDAPRYVCDYMPLSTEIVQRTNAICPLLSFQPIRGRMREEFHIFEDVIKLQPEAIGLAHSQSRAPQPSVQAFSELLASQI